MISMGYHIRRLAIALNLRHLHPDDITHDFLQPGAAVLAHSNPIVF